MAYAYSNTIIATFDDRRSADRAMTELRRAGIPNSQIGIAGPHTESDYPTTDSAIDEPSPEPHHIDEVAEGAGAGAEAGATLGAGVGALVGLGIVAGIIPAIGPVIAGGTLAVILANAAGGAAIAGIGGALIGMGVSETEAQHYESEIKSGKTIVTVQGEMKEDQVAEILYRNGGRDRQNSWTAQHAKHRPGAPTEIEVTPHI